MARFRNPLRGVRTTTVGIVGLTAMWTGFQVFDSAPPPVLDQLLVAAFGIWFATETKRNSGDDDEKPKKPINPWDRRDDDG